SHMFFDAIVWMGLQLVKRLKKSPNKKQETPKNYVVYSTNDINKLLESLPFKAEKLTELNKVPSNTEVVFDANSLSFKEIIQNMI
ncbi:hypothetical protein H2O73_21310, partial [Vibrio sp. 404]|nr:hypothetical protein [Vibrio marinisediminis]